LNGSLALGRSWQHRAMTLTTRCPSCNTDFKVVRDQLQLANGWVRCGRCAETFAAHDALEQLRAQSGSQAPLAQAAQGAPAAEPAGPRLTDNGLEMADDTQASPTAPLFRMAQANMASLQRVDEQIAALLQQRSRLQDELQELAERPGWAAVGSVALVSLMIQAALTWHDELAQAMPALRPTLEVACVMAECRIEPARRIESLTIESSQLVHLGGTIYQFSLTIRNRAKADLTPPALDLVLTDLDGQIVARRVLRWADFGLRARSIAAQKDLNLQTNLNTGSTVVAGFTIELFYP
jgi:predicted Zn finger-like uncharacterized protein